MLLCDILRVGTIGVLLNKVMILNHNQALATVEENHEGIRSFQT
jgi:hypothetical protein